MLDKSDDPSPPKGLLNVFPPVVLVSPKLGVVGEVTLSFSSSSTTLCIGPVSILPEPKGLVFAPKGLVKPALDIAFRQMLLRGIKEAYKSTSLSRCAFAAVLGLINSRKDGLVRSTQFLMLVVLLPRTETCGGVKGIKGRSASVQEMSMSNCSFQE